jgi:hypothetical protein
MVPRIQMNWESRGQIKERTSPLGTTVSWLWNAVVPVGENTSGECRVSGGRRWGPVVRPREPLPVMNPRRVERRRTRPRPLHPFFLPKLSPLSSPLPVDQIRSHRLQQIRIRLACQCLPPAWSGCYLREFILILHFFSSFSNVALIYTPSVSKYKMF